MIRLGEDAGIDLDIVVRRPCDLGECAARHQDDASAELLDGFTCSR